MTDWPAGWPMLLVVAFVGWLGLVHVLVAAAVTAADVGTVELGEIAQEVVRRDGRAAGGPLVVRAWYAVAPDGRPAVASSRPEGGAGSTRPCPVLFFNPGWGGGSTGHLTQIRDLVRHGFVVVGVDHPTPGDVPAPFLDFSSDAAYARSRRALDERADRDAWDNVHVLEALQTPRAGGLGVLAGRLDFGRVGILGYSFGGAVAAQTCWRSALFRACANLDGWLFAQSAALGFSQPFLEVSDDSPSPTLADLSAADAGRRLKAEQDASDEAMRRERHRRHGGYWLVIEGATHESFVDVASRSERGRLAALVPEPQPALQTAVAYTTAFFQHHLAGLPSALLGPGPSPYVRAHLTVWRNAEAVRIQ